MVTLTGYPVVFLYDGGIKKNISFVDTHFDGIKRTVAADTLRFFLFSWLVSLQHITLTFPGPDVSLLVR